MNEQSQLTIDSRLIPLRMRRDLVVQGMRYDGLRHWAIKDPVSLRFFQLRDEEYFVLSSLDGQSSVETIRRGFEQRFAPLRLGDRQLQSYLGNLHHQGLVVADAPGQGAALFNRRRTQRRGQMLSTLTNVLAIRFRGLDPDRLLRWLYPLCRLFFTRAFVAASIVLAIAAIILLMVQHETLLARLPSFQAFFTPRNLLLIGVALAIVKVLHEFGHALACRHFGGECHEMGIMLLVFTPCLYCDVSDAWMMKNKWHRIAIGGAGMCVEAVLASICTFLWWFSEPGLLNAIFLNLMFVCSVSTIVLNGNPLLRYDGYYMLADYLEIPNLRSRASALLSRVLGRLCLGIKSTGDRRFPARRRNFLLAYAIASLAYRIVVVVAMLWFFHAMLSPYGLQIVAQAITVMMVGGMLLVPLAKFMRFITKSIRSGEVNRFHASVFAAAVIGAIVLVCAWPIPSSVSAPAVIQPYAGAAVYVEVAGRLPAYADRVASRVSYGDRVARGDSLITLANITIEKDIARLDAQIALLEQRAESLRTMRVQRDDASELMPTARETLNHVRRQLTTLREDRQRLTIRAPRDGLVLPPQAGSLAIPADELETWSGHPLDVQNAGATLETGTPLCVIGDPRELEAVVMIAESDAELVAAGQRVRVRIEQYPGTSLTGTVLEIAEGELEALSPGLLASGRLPVTFDEHGVPRPVNPPIQARVKLDRCDLAILLQVTGEARIDVAPQSLGSRVYRYLRNTFRLEL